MYNYKCLACGASLDAGESCDCNEKGLPSTKTNSPRDLKESIHILPHRFQKVNRNPKNISIAELYMPKNCKPIQSDAEKRRKPL